MRQARFQNGSAAHVLEANAASAGLALGCIYSSSDEYEAEIIEARRRAGACRTQRQAFVGFAFATLAAVLVLFAF